MVLHHSNRNPKTGWKSPWVLRALWAVPWELRRQCESTAVVRWFVEFQGEAEMKDHLCDIRSLCLVSWD